MRRSNSGSVFLAASLALAAGCRTASLPPNVQIDIAHLPSDAFIEDASGQPGLPLDVDSVIRLALDNSPAIRILRSAADVARAEASTFPELRDPELSFAYGEGDRVTERRWYVPRAEVLSGDGNVIVPPGQSGAYLEESPRAYRGTTADLEMSEIGVRFFPPNPWIVRARGAVNRANYAAALSDLYAAEWSTACSVRALFARILFLTEDSRLLDEVIAARRVAADTARELADSGEMHSLDAMAASQRHIEALSDKNRNAQDMAAARAELDLLVGRTVVMDPAGGERKAPLVPRAADIASMDLNRWALENRREVSSAYWRAQAASAALREARAARIPWFTRIGGSYRQSERRERPGAAWELSGDTDLGATSTLPVDHTEDTEWQVEAIITIPLFSLGARATRVQNAERQQTRVVLAETAKGVMQEVASAVELLRVAEERDLSMLDQLTPRLQQTAALLADVSERTDLNPVDIARIREVAAGIQRMLARSRADYLAAVIRLDQALGLSLSDLSAHRGAAATLRNP